jgi:hypothetical protein
VDEASTDGFLRGRVISESIDAEMIQGWMRRCMEMHGDDCKQSYLQAAPHPAVTIGFVVIDVNKECLVNMPSAAKYVALSYVWGQANHLTTVKSVVSEFHMQGAFKKRKPPRTIQDAIDLTRALGVQYLSALSKMKRKPKNFLSPIWTQCTVMQRLPLLLLRG